MLAGWIVYQMAKVADFPLEHSSCRLGWYYSVRPMRFPLEREQWIGRSNASQVSTILKKKKTHPNHLLARSRPDDLSLCRSCDLLYHHSVPPLPSPGTKLCPRQTVITNEFISVILRTNGVGWALVKPTYAIILSQVGMSFDYPQRFSLTDVGWFICA